MISTETITDTQTSIKVIEKGRRMTFLTSEIDIKERVHQINSTTTK